MKKVKTFAEVEKYSDKRGIMEMRSSGFFQMTIGVDLYDESHYCIDRTTVWKRRT